MYSNYFSIDKNFQSSVNLELDLNNESRIDEYIPTSDICDVLKKYIQAVLGVSKDKATTLIGPYGKGKSFLLLVLTFILGKNKKTDTWKKLIIKIRAIDSELHSLILEILKRDISLLPVIINSNYDNVTQSFQIALNEALKRDGLDSIIPNSVYEICISLLDKWNSQDQVKEEVLSKCLKLNNLTLKKLKNGLENYSPTAYKQFENLYNCVNIGLEFNPLISNDIVKTYSDISQAVTKFGYNGILIIFDEFSKFIESNTSNLMKDLKIVQDMAELCARSGKNNQVHLCCVAHKSIALYKDQKNHNYALDSFKTLEGRFKEVRFNRSLEENYQIIAYAIKKTSNADEIILSYLQNQKPFYKNISSMGVFNENIDKETLFKGCFPLNPLTAFSLIQISEYSAQNERTLFTFLSDTDEDSFNSFIHNNSDGLFNVDKIYDYFSPLLQKEEANYIRNIWYRTESILSKIEDQNERKVIKALSIILMINDLENFPSTEKVISLALSKKETETIKIINNLIDKHYLRKNLLNNLLSFALSNTKQIDDAVELYKKTKFKVIRYGEYADKVNEHRYIIPRRYNEINKIVRFYKVAFLSEDEFFGLKSVNYYFENNYCDGLVIYLLRNKCSIELIKNKIFELHDMRVIVKYPYEKIEKVFYNSLIRFACLKEVEKQKGLDEIAQNEISLLLEETESDIKSLIEKYYISNCGFFSIYNCNGKTFNTVASAIMDKVYSVKLIFNNELINKKTVSAQYQKAINHVIDWILDRDIIFSYSATSPEMSIKTSILDSNDILVNQTISAKNFRVVIEDIKNSISSSKGNKITIKEIVTKFFKPPYGIREGVMPLLVAKAISELSDNIVLYFQSKEIELDSGNIVKAITNEKYQLFFSKGSLEQKNYLKKMLSLFGCESVNNFRKDSLILADAIKRFFIGLPQIARLTQLSNNYLNISEDLIMYKNLFLKFNINPYEAVYEEPKKLFVTNDYNEIFKKIELFVKFQDRILLKYKSSLVKVIKNIFKIDSGSSLKTGTSAFIGDYIKPSKTPILDPQNKAIYECINNNNSYDDIMFASSMAKCVTGHFIEDWDSDKTEVITNAISSFVVAIKNSQKIDSKDLLFEVINSNPEVGGMASLLKNNMESVLEEFSGSVSSSDKIAVLSQLLKELL